MKLLLHACCGPCACYPTKILRSQDVDFTLLYYNPNIHPYKEFKHRLAALRELAEKQDYRLIIDKTYPLEECVKGMLEEPIVRCAFCYRMRLRYTAKYAADHGFTAFSTTLLYSPYQKHELILQIAKAAAEEFGVEFFYQDWRPHYQEGVDISLALGLYRQPYCGCVFSERAWISAWLWDCTASPIAVVCSVNGTVIWNGKKPKPKQGTRAIPMALSRGLMKRKANPLSA